jgi:hypothetical protein
MPVGTILRTPREKRPHSSGQIPRPIAAGGIAIGTVNNLKGNRVTLEKLEFIGAEG